MPYYIGRTYPLPPAPPPWRSAVDRIREAHAVQPPLARDTVVWHPFVRAASVLPTRYWRRARAQAAARAAWPDGTGRVVRAWTRQAALHHLGAEAVRERLDRATSEL
jgi:hypothetical protein